MQYAAWCRRLPVVHLSLSIVAAPGTFVAGQEGVVTQTYDRRELGRQWFVSETPSLVIGEAMGPEEYLLTNPLAAMRLSDGTIVIRDSANGFFHLRFYDGAGQHLATVSAWGEGPYEFRRPLGVHEMRGDSVLVLGEGGKFAVFGSRGERIREGHVRDREAFIGSSVWSHSFDGRLVLVGKLVDAAGLPDPGVQRPDVLFAWVGFDQPTRPLPPVLGSPGYFEPSDNGVFAYPYPFAPATSGVTTGAVAWIAQGDQPEIRGYDSTGSLSVVLRFSDPAPRVAGEDRRRFRSEVVRGSTGAGEARWARYARSVPFPETHPHVGRLEADDEGNLWVQRYELPWATSEQLWDVFDESGEWIATASLPSSVVPPCDRRARWGRCDRILEIGHEYVLMALGDFGDVRRVALYELRRN